MYFLTAAKHNFPKGNNEQREVVQARRRKGKGPGSKHWNKATYFLKTQEANDLIRSIH